MDIIGLLGVLASLAVGSALLLATYTWFRVEERKEQDFLLTALMIAVALRIGKSIWYFILYGAAPFGVGLGYLGLASIGPLVFLYLRAGENKGQQWQLSDSIHFLLPVVGALAIWLVIPAYATLLYRTTTVLLLLYLLFSWFFNLHFIGISLLF